MALITIKKRGFTLYQLLDLDLFSTVFALFISIWMLFREIKTRARISAVTFYILSILGLCALTLDTIFGISAVYDPGIDALLDYIRYAAGAAISLLIIYMGFMYGNEQQLFWTKLFAGLLMFMAIVFLISIYL